MSSTTNNTRSKTMQFSFWLRNSILAGSSSSEHGNSNNSTSNTTHNYRTSSTTTHSSLPPEYDYSSNETTGTTDWIVQPQNIDEVLLCLYNGKTSSTTQQQPVAIDWMGEELNLGYDWILDGECDIAAAAEDGKQQPTVGNHSAVAAAATTTTTNSSGMQLTLDHLSLEEEEEEEDAQQPDSSTPSLVQQRRQQEKPRLFVNSHLVKLLPLTDTETNKTPLHKFARTSHLLMIQELERRQKSLGALEEEHSLLSHSCDNTAIPRIIQCFPDTDDDDHSIAPSSPFTLTSDQTLPLHFYHQGYDPVGHLLQSMPKGRSSKTCTVTTADNFITQLLSRADEYQTTIKAELNSLIGSRKADIQQGIQQLQSIDREIGASLLHWNQARYYVDSARRQTFLQESLTLIQNSILRTKYKQLLKILDECNDIRVLEQELNSLISLYTSDDTIGNTTNSFHAQWKPHSVEDYQKFLSMENDLKARAFSSDNGLDALRCFSKLRQRTSTILTTTVGTLLFKELNRVLSITCQTNELSNSHYSTLLQVSTRATLNGGRERVNSVLKKFSGFFFLSSI